MSKYQPILRNLSSRQGPEQELLKAAMRCGLPVGFEDHRLMLLEASALPTGIPDLIVVEARNQVETTARKRRRFQLAHLQILHFLNDYGATTSEEIVRLLNHSRRKTAQVLSDLEEAGFIRRQRNRIAPCSLSKVFVAKRIVAIEAKMRAWRDALNQATGNLWFASHSYILVPALNCIRLICSEARKLGIGVLVFDGRKTRMALRPRKQRIPASYGSWLINEWALDQLHA